MAPSQLGCFAFSSPRQATPDLEYHVQPLSLDAFGQPLHRFDAITASVCNLRPLSRGAVTLRGPDPAAAPAIRPNYLDDPADRSVALDALRLTRRICAAPAFAKFRPVEYLPGASLDSDGGRAGGDRPDLHHHFPPRRNLRHGDGCEGRGRSPLAGAGYRWPSGGGRLDHAEHHFRQHPRPDGHDRGKGCGYDLARCARRRGLLSL